MNNPDDREDTIPTGWWVYSHQTAAQVNTTASSLNARIVDIYVEQFSPSYLFTVTYVQNAGPYYKGSWWYYGVDSTSLGNLLTTNNARIVSLKAYDIGGGAIRFAVSMVANTGKDNKGWWWYFGQTASQVASLLSTNNARLVQLHSYVTGGQTLYAVAMISNTGADQKGWFWYLDTPPSQLDSLVNSNNARIVDLDYIPSDGNYNVIMESCAGGCPGWWWYYGQSGTQMINLANQFGARIIDTNSYPGCGDLCYTFAMVDNSQPALDATNSITTRIGNLLRANGVTGVQGLYLKQVGGPVLANLEESFVYEPASSIKVLAHLYTMNQIQLGHATLNTTVPHYTNGAASCPDPATVSGTETLNTAMGEMMRHSDNARTREITDHWGDANINAFGASIGMLNTNFNHIVGCGGPIPDQLTQADAARLYEGVANNTLLTPANQSTFYSLMAGKAQFQFEGYDWTHLWDTDIPNIIAQSAPGASTTQRQNYLNQMNLAYKAGSYTLCDSSCTNAAEYLSISGWAQIPFCSGGTTNYQSYVFGIYLHGAIDSSWFSGKNTVADQNFNNAKSETLREQIVAGLASCGLAPFTFSALSINFGPGAASGSVNITAPSSLAAWTAVSNDSWITITSGFGGTGNGSVAYSLTVNPSTYPRTGTITIAGTTYTVIQAGSGQQFLPVTPCRIADTRNPTGPFGGPAITGGTARSFAIPSSACGIPSTATAYSINVTVAPRGQLGYLTIYPTGQAVPLASTLNSLDGRVKANAAIVPAGSGAAVSVFVTDTTDVILDINGYFVTTATGSTLTFFPLTPCRIADTRSANGPLGGPFMSAGQDRTFPVLSSPCNVPATAQAYSLNFTAVPRGTLGYITTWPTGRAQPLVSTLNAITGQVTANAAIVPAGTSGQIEVFAANATDLVIDINGYFAPPGSGGLQLYDLVPCRVLDTRNPSGSPPITGTGSVNVAGSPCAAPASAQAYVLSATVVPSGLLGYLTLWPQGLSQPLVSTLNALDGAVTSNMALVPTSNGSINDYVANPTHLILDISGYLAP